MSFIVYDDNPTRRAGAKFDFENADATKFYLEHYYNYLYLKFIANNKLATFTEKQQASKELVICERKLEYWRRHKNFKVSTANEGITKLQREWSAQ